MVEVKNIQGITKITFMEKIHNYCSLGNDWYSNNLTIELEPNENIPDYVKVGKKIKALEEHNLIIEDVIMAVPKIIEEYKPKSYRIVSEVNDATHMPVKVEKKVVLN